MFGTTTWTHPLTPAPAAPSGPDRDPVEVRRVRVTRRAVRTHRGRRRIALPTIRRADAYVVRVHRPTGAVPSSHVIALRRAAVPHRARVAR